MKKFNTVIGVFILNLLFGGCIYADPIDQFGNTYELVLIYSSDCPHCQRFVPIFADVVKHYNINYDAFTMNGGTLSQVASHTYPANQQIVSNFYQGMQQGVVPAVFIINVNTMDELPISIGEEPEDQFIADVNRVAAVLFAEESTSTTTGSNSYSQATVNPTVNGSNTSSWRMSPTNEDNEDDEENQSTSSNTAPEDTGISDAIESTSLGEE